MIYAHAHGRLNDIHTVVVVVVSIFKRFTSRFFEMSFLLLLFLLVFFIYFVLHSFASEFRGSSFRVFTQLVLFFYIFVIISRSSRSYFSLCLSLILGDSLRCFFLLPLFTAATMSIGMHRRNCDYVCPPGTRDFLSVLDGKSQKWLLSEKEIFPIIFLEDFHSRECDSS